MIFYWGLNKAIRPLIIVLLGGRFLIIVPGRSDFSNPGGLVTGGYNYIYIYIYIYMYMSSSQNKVTPGHFIGQILLHALKAL